MVLGANTFTTAMDGTVMVNEPLLDINFTGLELDFFVSIEDQYVRIFTIVTDLHLPLGMQVNAAGELEPVFGDLAGAFTNLSVKNSEALTEDPAQLAMRFPALLELALPGLAGGLGSFALPALGGLNIEVTDITAVDGKQFLAIFANLVPAMKALPPVATEAQIDDVLLPGADALADPDRWTTEDAPRIALALGGDARDLEWSTRVDDSLWSAWSPYPTRTISSRTLWLPGIHRVEVRARERGHSETIDPTPVVLELPVAPERGQTPRRLPRRARRGRLQLREQRPGRPTRCRSVLVALGAAGASAPARARSRDRGVASARPSAPDRRAGARARRDAAGVRLRRHAAVRRERRACPARSRSARVGRYNGGATDGTRTVFSTFDAFLGDAGAGRRRRHRRADATPRSTASPTRPRPTIRRRIAAASPPRARGSAPIPASRCTTASRASRTRTSTTSRSRSRSRPRPVSSAR
jgi:hypothetical protein